MGEVILFRDYQSEVARRRAQKALEEHLKEEAAQLMGGFWHNDAGTVGLNPFYAPDKDPA